ncbi:MAG: hydrogenase maturation protease [Chloroflexi bacterium]|nr:hydrogenase maturation protease [Chloroflexota bacterium]
MGDTLILGLGNPLRGDDGVGTAVISALQTQNLPPNVDLVDGGTSGLEVVLLLKEYRRVIVVDAADMGKEPGEWVCFEVETACPREGVGAVLPHNESSMNGTLHGAGFAEALALAEALGALPQELLIFGVQPQRVDWVEGLSRGVETAVSHLCQAVLAQV